MRRLTALLSALILAPVAALAQESTPTPAGGSGGGDDLNRLAELAEAWFNAEPGPMKTAAAIVFFGTVAFVGFQLLKKNVPAVDAMPPMAKRMIAGLLAAVPAVAGGIELGQPIPAIVIAGIGAVIAALTAHKVTRGGDGS